MVIAYDVNTVQEYVAQAALMGPARPVLIDQFLAAKRQKSMWMRCRWNGRGYRRNYGAHRRSRSALGGFLLRAAAR